MTKLLAEGISAIPSATLKSRLVEAPSTEIKSRKRKADSIDATDAANWFSAEILAPSKTNSVSAVSFSCISTLLRAHLPLTWLCNTPQPQSLLPGTVIKANISSVVKWDYHVLIARQLPNGGLFAIEHIESDAFVCYPLQSFVKTEWAHLANIGANPPVDLGELITNATRTHTRSASISSASSCRVATGVAQEIKQPTCHRGVLARQSILAKGRIVNTTEPACDLQETQDPATILTDSTIQSRQYQQNPFDAVQNNEQEPHPRVNSDENHTMVLVIDETNQSQKLGVNDVIGKHEAVSVDASFELQNQLSPEYLRKRYLEMLYLSKTSLAFYAKGPLSRTRARARNPDTSMTLKGLAEFYRGLILPIKKLDLKYKESIQKELTSIAQQKDTGDGTLRTAFKKTRQTKLGKTGLWPIENEFIAKWWERQETRTSQVQSPDQAVKSVSHLLSLLRMREMELQVILVLEVMSLEGLEKVDENGVSNQSARLSNESVLTSHDLQDLQGNPAPTTKKKPRDLRADLEVLLDKLCILHSIGDQDSAIIGTNDPEDFHAATLNTKDSLSDFCKDVVVPFYANKLSDQCRSICKKLGGSAMSPCRTKLPVEDSDAKASPGTAINAKERLFHKRPLHRVFSAEENIRHPPPPILSRSATVPTTLSLKREPSERPASRGGMQKSRSFSNREIDLVADAHATAAKKRKLDQIASQKRELEAAIETLKKPNRSIVAQRFMDDVDKRRTDKSIPSRKNDPVQITATPKTSRARNTTDADYELPPMPLFTSGPKESYVPSSTVKPRGLYHVSNTLQSTEKKRAVLSAIHDTPPRTGLPKAVVVHSETERRLSQHDGPPSQSSSTLVDSTPNTSRLRADLIPPATSTPISVKSCHHAVFSTPIKQQETSLEDVFKDAPNIRARANLMMNRAMKVSDARSDVSIYESLGWNDDYES